MRKGEKHVKRKIADNNDVSHSGQIFWRFYFECIINSKKQHANIDDKHGSFDRNQLDIIDHSIHRTKNNQIQDDKDADNTMHDGLSERSKVEVACDGHWREDSAEINAIEDVSPG